MIFVLDGSGSIGSSNFLSIKKFVKDVVSAFDIGLDKTRIGVIKFRLFSHSCVVMIGIPLSIVVFVGCDAITACYWQQK